ncbi:DUF3299 domain-containing protein [Saccharospirillum sp. HFRX-1]|uniref:DUF3299 domain-containing protein n=1 Tax=unclassified Saccharospirillum TaxID=2633430 RepID=UPI0037136D78
MSIRLPLFSLVFATALLSACGQSDDKVSADIEAQANQPAVEPALGATPSQLSAEERDLEPSETIEPIANPDDLAYRELSWDDLLPEDFDFQTIRDQIDLDSYNIQELDDSDPEAQRLFADLQDAMSQVPLVTSLDGQQTRLPGFLVPLENAGDAVREFFLVPYYGACIHTPPPPSNQIVHVVLDEAIPFDNLFEPYWAEGTLTIAKTETDIGTAGYRFEAAKIRPYE